MRGYYYYRQHPNSRTQVRLSSIIAYNSRNCYDYIRLGWMLLFVCIEYCHPLSIPFICIFIVFPVISPPKTLPPLQSQILPVEHSFNYILQNVNYFIQSKNLVVGAFDSKKLTIRIYRFFQYCLSSTEQFTRIV
jgi:hypothetical protein